MLRKPLLVCTEEFERHVRAIQASVTNSLVFAINDYCNPVLIVLS